MGFTIGPALSAVLGAGIGAGGALGAAKIGSNRMKSIADQQNALQRRLLNISEPALRESTDFFRNLLRGSPSELASALGRPITETNLQFDALRKVALAGDPARSGGIDRNLRNIESGRASSISNLLQRSPFEAAGQLGALASGTLGEAAGILGSARQAGVYESQLRQQGLSSIGSWIQRFLTTPGLFDKTTPNPVAPPAPIIPNPTSSFDSLRYFQPNEIRGRYPGLFYPPWGG